MTNEQPADVLVVDDDEGVRDVLRRILERAGYRVRTATHSHDALRQLRESAPAVVVTDVHMPGPSGVWLAQQIREECPQAAVVLVTTDRSVPPADSMRRGIVAYLIKPFDPARVLAAVAEAYAWWARQSGREMPALVPRQAAAGAAVGAPAGYAPVHAAAAPQSGYTGRQDERPQSGAAVDQPQARTVPLKLVVIGAVIVAVIVLALMYWLSRDGGRRLSRVTASSGKVLLYDGAGKRLKQGSGFFVGSDLVVTNHHVVADGVRATFVIGAEEYLVAGVVGVDRAHDLVLLKTARPGASHLTLSASSPVLGDEIAVYGAPRGLDGTLTTGIVSTDRKDPGDRIQFTAPISPGSSGSPLIDAAGDVVGVVASSSTVAQAVHFAVPAVRVQALLDAAGPVQPLVAVSRGAADDRERNELVGPVRAVTWSPSGTQLFFDRAGRIIERDSGAAGKVRYQYDDEGRLASEIHLEGQTARETWSYTALGPHIVEASDADSGRVKRVQYDSNGRLQSEEIRLGARTLSAQAWSYPAHAWPATIATTADGDTLDALGNPLRRILADGSVLSFSYRFDARGNWLRREVVKQDRDGRPMETSFETRTVQYWDDVEN